MLWKIHVSIWCRYRRQSGAFAAHGIENTTITILNQHFGFVIRPESLNQWFSQSARQQKDDHKEEVEKGNYHVVLLIFPTSSLPKPYKPRQVCSEIFRSAVAMLLVASMGVWAILACWELSNAKPLSEVSVFQCEGILYNVTGLEAFSPVSTPPFLGNFSFSSSLLSSPEHLRFHMM